MEITVIQFKRSKDAQWELGVSLDTELVVDHNSRPVDEIYDAMPSELFHVNIAPILKGGDTR
ncbi:hypothetical protein SAMN05216389_12123 [Oceanobacillus limi]|uniref:Uncharacterized protein n=1 Tax=Oceanobacillus limi TaxID=930131 RepID=A0A1I0GEI6_9BACI|nr:hypothetical protein [Oceanobacillus limi]SET69463.1 hypothetical protein SAMN05216389_12123 [Oceanobacillus limi]